MSAPPVTIPNPPPRTHASDYYRLRREGIGFIEQMASALWTDYNTHDPGITILEGLCYVITELAYRSGWEVKDLLAPDPASASAPARQAFFPASEILTVNPVTPDDFRRLLIGLDRVRNAWVFCKECACDVRYYAWCEDDQLKLGYRAPADPALKAEKVDVRGMYEVLLELEADPEAGDLNDRKIELSPRLPDAGGGVFRLTMELRFPQWELARPHDWHAFLEAGGVSGVTLLALGATKDYDVLGDPALDDAGRDSYLRAHWNRALYASLEVQLAPGSTSIVIEHAALHLFADNAARNATTVAALKLALEAPGADGFAGLYMAKARKVAAAVGAAREQLATHRNLDEDYCRIKGVDIEDVAVCADIEVAAGADIELVQAQAWFLIERNFNPPVPHYSLQELVDAGMPVEEIFNGPLAQGGFIKTDDLAAAGLKGVLRGSDIINLLMEIDGVLAVKGLLLTKYDEEGAVVSGAAWQLYVSPLHQPRLYFARSRFLFFKNGLPFLPRMDEAADTLAQLRGEAERPKIGNAATDFQPPAGTFRDPAQYTPLQYSFPLTYGIGPAGLPAHATPRRRAQARQLQAYLMVFEQSLASAYAQLAHAGDLLSLDPALAQTYFAGKLGPAVIGAYAKVVDAALTEPVLAGMLETPEEFLVRRNRFLDHLLARFGENFSDYALLLTNLRGEQAGRERLIADKIAFLDAYPVISRERARAFDYAHLPCAPENRSGIARRISLLLGYPDLAFSWTFSAPATVSAYALKDQDGRTWLSGTLAAPVVGPDNDAAIEAAYRAIVARMTQEEAWQAAASGAGFRLALSDRDLQPMGEAPELFASVALAQERMGELISWSSNARALVVEHLLLRPKFPGDALYPVCADGTCSTCDNADPYSFRLSFVMPGWTEPFNTNLDMRSFADRTIAAEIPSHLLAKICWVGNDGFIENPCDPVIAALAGLLETQGAAEGGGRPDPDAACSCANALYAAFSNVFDRWYQDRLLDYMAPDALRAALETLFAGQPDLGAAGCSTLFDEALSAQVRSLMAAHFQAVAAGGWQFERFDRAWCEWLTANAAFDWSTERLQARVEALLGAGLAGGPPAGDKAVQAVCACAAGIVAGRGEQFDGWIEANIRAGRGPAEFDPFVPAPAVLCAGMLFKPGTEALLEALLGERYGAYAQVSYWLRIVLRLLGGLRNTYPGATLHDCDDGSDVNPVRLGSTALGNYPRPRKAPAPVRATLRGMVEEAQTPAAAPRAAASKKSVKRTKPSQK
jgi:hypothetical protein